MLDTWIRAWVDVTIYSTTDDERELPRVRHVRLYPGPAHRVTLQIRSKGSVGISRMGRRICLSNARLTIDEAKELHAALGEWIVEQTPSSRDGLIKRPTDRRASR